MKSPLICALALAAFGAPAFAQDPDERPEYQFLEGITACLMGEGDVEKTTAALAAFGWTAEAQAEMGLVEFVPAVGEATFAYMSDAVEFCQIESTVMGTRVAEGMLELYLADGSDPVLTAEFGTTADGCAMYTLSNGVVVEVTSGGNDPICQSETNSALRFLFTP